MKHIPKKNITNAENLILDKGKIGARTHTHTHTHTR